MYSYVLETDLILLKRSINYHSTTNLHYKQFHETIFLWMAGLYTAQKRDVVKMENRTALWALWPLWSAFTPAARSLGKETKLGQ